MNDEKLNHLVVVVVDFLFELKIMSTSIEIRLQRPTKTYFENVRRVRNLSLRMLRGGSTFKGYCSRNSDYSNEFFI